MNILSSLFRRNHVSVSPVSNNPTDKKQTFTSISNTSERSIFTQFKIAKTCVKSRHYVPTTAMEAPTKSNSEGLKELQNTKPSLFHKVNRPWVTNQAKVWPAEEGKLVDLEV